MGPGILILACLATLVVLDRLLCRYAIRKVADIFENVPPFNVVSESNFHDARAIQVKTADGLALAGSLHWPGISSPHGLVVFFPELNGNHLMARRYCEALLADGFAILAFDFRGQGESESAAGYSPIHWVTEYEMADVSGVLEFIESDPVLSTMPLLAFGVSRGGVAALLSGARYPRFRAVIADSAFGTMPMILHYVNRFAAYVIPGWLYELLPSWHVRRTLKHGVQLSQKRRNCRYVHLENEVSGLADTPVLLISGQRDTYVIPEIARQLQSLIGATSELWMVDGAKHNMGRTASTAEYDRRITEHFREALGLSAASPGQIVLPASTTP